MILDEAHCIKNPATAVSRACCMLKAGKRWCKYYMRLCTVRSFPDQRCHVALLHVSLYLMRHTLLLLLTGVTGTPIQNSLQDVYALIKFLKHEPWCESGFWKAAITNASTEGNGDEDDKKIPKPGSSTIGNKTEGAPTGANVALNRVKRLLAPLILRRTKDTLNKDGYDIAMIRRAYFDTYEPE